MKQTLIRIWSNRGVVLLSCVVLLVAALPQAGFANPMIHNSANLGSPKWGGNWGTATGQYGEFTCATCHARNTGNIKRVKTDISFPDGSLMPNGTLNSAVILQDVRNGSSDFGDDDPTNRPGGIATTSTKVCEVCHTFDDTDNNPADGITDGDGVKYHAYDMDTPGAGNPGHYNNADCMICHPHNQGFKPVDCTACHGMPPTTTDRDGSTTTGLANNKPGSFWTGSTLVGAHDKHATVTPDLNYDCTVCHSGYVMPDNGDINISFNAFGDVSGTYDGQVAVTYDGVNGGGSLTCSSVYCHGGTIGGTAPAWDGAAMTCGACHDAAKADVAGLPSSGSHDQHANTLDLDCSKCHGAGYTSGSAAPAGHVSGATDWDLDRTDTKFGTSAAYNGTETGASAGRAPSTYSDCSNIYCHSAGQNASGGALAGGDYANPTWGGTVNCGDCHATTTLASGSHNAHLTFTGSSIGCDQCHNGANASGTAYAAAAHVDGLINVAGASGTTYSEGASHAPASGYGDCSTTVCHGNSTPTWGGGAMNCDSCHGANNSMPGSHGVHYNVATVALAGDLTAANNAVFGNYEFSCGVCHDGAAHVNGEVSANQRAEVLFNAAIAGGSASYSPGAFAGDDNGLNYTSGTCNTNSCHDDGLGGGPNTPPVWGGAAMSCNDCHDSKPADAVHARHVDYPLKPYNYNCSECHAVTTTDGTSINDYRQHVDGDKDVDWGAKNSDAPGYVDADTTCAVYCHSDGTRASAPYTNVNAPPYPIWNSAPVDGCGKCHSSGANVTTNAHELHASFNQDKTGRQIDCSDCHNATATSIAGLTPEGYSTYHVNKEINVKFDSSLNLDGDNTSGPSYNSASAIGAAGSSVTPGTAVGDCSNLYCHSIGNLADISGSGAVVTAGGEDFKTVAWSTTGLDCADCHGDGTNVHPKYSNGGAGTTTANSHVKHVESANLACYVCHEATTTDAAIPPTTVLTSSSHLDRIETVSFNSAVVGGSASYDGTVTNKTCSTTYCHGAGTPQWGGAALNCNECHEASSALADSHGVHYNSSTVVTSNSAGRVSDTNRYIFNCGNCHDSGSTSHAGGEAFPGEAAAEVTLGDYTKGSSSFTDSRNYNYTNATCGTNDCHNDGTAAKGAPNTVNPQWTSSLPNDCTGCHDNNAGAASTMGTDGGSATHAIHVNTSNHGASKTCKTCHDDTVSADQAILDKNLHINGVRNVAIIASFDGGNSAYAGSCDAVYCHSPGQNSSGGALVGGDYVTATWDTASSGDCGTCHKVTEGTGLTSGSHAAHLGTSYGNSTVNGCGDCHTGAANDASSYNSAQHVDMDMDVANTYNSAGGMGNGYGTCTAASCHDDGTGSPAETPRWGTTVNDCSECHANSPATGAHATHFSAVGSLIDAIACDNCHSDAVQGSSAPSVGHVDGNLDIYNSAANDLGYTANVASTAPLYNVETCNTSYCHGDNMPKGTTSGTTNAPTWGATNGSGCDYCHDTTTAPEPGTIGAHVGKTATDCIDCHGAGSGDVNGTGTGFTNGGATHIDGIVQGGGDNCTDCHGADIDGGKNGVHASHTDTATFLSGKTVSGGDYGTNGWYTTTWSSGKPNFGCGECHPAAEGTSHPVNGLNLDMDPAGELPTAGSPKLKNTDGPTTPTFSTGSSVTCSNIYCHSDAAATPSYATSPNWYGGTVSGNCDDCHGNSPATNAHALHAVGIHYDTLLDDDGDGLMAKDPTETGASGGADSAHGNSATSDTISCQTCHADTVAVDYNSSNSICTTCHAGATGSPATGDEKVVINTAGSTHVNAQPDVAFNVSSFKSKAQLRNDLSNADDGTNILSELWVRMTTLTSYKAGDGSSYDQLNSAILPTYNSGAKTCSTAACHNSIEATWTDSNVNCMYCHTSLPQ